MENPEPFRAGPAADVLAFEQANRHFFASSISDRGQAFFDEFDEQFAAMLDEQQAIGCASYVLLGGNGVSLRHRGGSQVVVDPGPELVTHTKQSHEWVASSEQSLSRSRG